MENSEVAIKRRDFVKQLVGGAALAGIGLPLTARAEERRVKIGFCAPLTGDAAAWGLPGLYGCEIWVERLNAAGGVKIGDDNYLVELAAFDNQYDPRLALEGYRQLVESEDVKFVMMLGGDTWGGVQDYANRREMLTSTLLPSDLSIDAPYLVAPCEAHPIYNVTGVDWLGRNFPELKRAGICAQADSLGDISIATYIGAFDAIDIDVVKRTSFEFDTTDFAPLVRGMLDAGVEVLCLDTAYSDYVDAITVEAFRQGFGGKIISCTCDNYRQLIAQTSAEFMENMIFQFPDFDDPALNGSFVNFEDPNRFYSTYNERHPGTWSAVSWEYASILELWSKSAARAGSVEPLDVLQAMKGEGRAPHAFGEASWWGEGFFGVNNALVGNWPVVTIRDGRARIAEFIDILAWWEQHSDTLLRSMLKNRQMWYQRGYFTS